MGSRGGIDEAERRTRIGTSWLAVSLGVALLAGSAIGIVRWRSSDGRAAAAPVESPFTKDDPSQPLEALAERPGPVAHLVITFLLDPDHDERASSRISGACRDWSAAAWRDELIAATGLHPRQRLDYLDNLEGTEIGEDEATIEVIGPDGRFETTWGLDPSSQRWMLTSCGG